MPRKHNLDPNGTIPLTSKGIPDKRIKPRKAPHRPLKPIDWRKVDELLVVGCPGTEVAANFDMHPDTFYNRLEKEKGISFTEYSLEKKQIGKSRLRSQQYSKAIGETKEGDNTLLIWLGKQDLGQCENPKDMSVSTSIEKNFAALMEQIDKLQEKAQDSDD